jgi:uncharacterized membrane protein
MENKITNQCFFPAKKSMLLYCCSLVLFVLYSGGVFSQTFQHVQHGEKHIEYVAGMVVYDDPLSNQQIGYIAVGNSTEFTAGTQENIVVTRYDNYGNVLWTRNVFYVNPDKIAYHATDVQPAVHPEAREVPCYPETDGVIPIAGLNRVKCYEKSDFYISGYYQEENTLTPRKMLLLKLSYDANIIWTRSKIGNYIQKNNDETGVSVEVSAREGDVFIVGHATDVYSKVSHTMVARFNSNGTLIWCNRYINPCNSDLLGYIPRQSCLYVDKNKQVGIAVCGRSTYPLGKILDHAFISRINPDGTEAWRMVSSSNDHITVTSGEDITLAKSDAGFVFAVTGYFVKRGGTWKNMYNFKTDDNGNQIVSEMITSGTEKIANYGQSITTDNGEDGYYVIAGGYNNLSDNSNYTLLLTSKIGSGLVWQKIYPTYSRPNEPATESAYERPNGYFIATNSNAPYGNPSALAIATDLNGDVNSPYCPAKDPGLYNKEEGQGFHVDIAYTPETRACPIDTKVDRIDPKDILCQGDGAPRAEDKKIGITQNQALSIFPNPAKTTLNIGFQSATGEEVSMVVYGFDGTIIEKRETKFLAGKNNQSWDISQLRAGTYLIQVTTADGRRFRKSWVKE